MAVMMVAVSTGALLAGCGASTGAAPPSSVEPAAHGAVPYPPQQIPVAGLDPCALLTPAQRGTLGVYPGTPGPPDDALGNAPTCQFRWSDNTPGAEYRITVAAHAGIDTLSDPAVSATYRQVTVGGFPGLDIVSVQTTARGCATGVNVSAGQLFEVSLELPPPRLSRAASCAATERVAAAVLLTARAAEHK